MLRVHSRSKTTAVATLLVSLMSAIALPARAGVGGSSDPPTINPPDKPRKFSLAQEHVVKWSASDDFGVVQSGVDLYYQRYSMAGSEPAGDIGRDFSPAELTVNVEIPIPTTPGWTFCAQIWATDEEDQTDSSLYDDTPCIAAPLDDTALETSNGWSRQKKTGYYLSTLSRSTKKGAVISLDDGSRGTQVAIVATKCPTCGKVDVRVGDEPAERVDLGSPTTRKSRIIQVFSTDGPAVLFPTIEIEVVTNDKPVIIDGLGILNRQFD